MKQKWILLLLFVFLLASFSEPKMGSRLKRQGKEIMVCGQLYYVGVPVVLWTDPGGYDAYRVERRFSPMGESSWDKSQKKIKYLTTPNRYGMRRGSLSAKELEQVRGGGWDLPTLQKVVDQFVLHFDCCGTSRQCFKVLHDYRGLSVHFMLDLDGTIYQTLDLKERAWHATTSNDRSIGIEIANMGDCSAKIKNPFPTWYKREGGTTRITIPKKLGDGGIRTKNFVGRPARPNPIVGVVQGGKVQMYDFTPQQYRSLVKLIAVLCKVFPKMKCDYPKDSKGKLIPKKLDDKDLKKYQGVLGHYHIQTNKVDPGPAFQWEGVMQEAKKLLGKMR